jgi:hypothetical protein
MSLVISACVARWSHAIEHFRPLRYGAHIDGVSIAATAVLLLSAFSIYWTLSREGSRLIVFSCVILAAFVSLIVPALTSR